MPGPGIISLVKQNTVYNSDCDNCDNCDNCDRGCDVCDYSTCDSNDQCQSEG